jgi:hypothetical protein
MADRAVDRIRDRFGWHAVGYGPPRWNSPDLIRTSFANWPKRIFDQCISSPAPALLSQIWRIISSAPMPVISLHWQVPKPHISAGVTPPALRRRARSQTTAGQFEATSAPRKSDHSDCLFRSQPVEQMSSHRIGGSQRHHMSVTINDDALPLGRDRTQLVDQFHRCAAIPIAGQE